MAFTLDCDRAVMAIWRPPAASLPRTDRSTTPASPCPCRCRRGRCRGRFARRHNIPWVFAARRSHAPATTRRRRRRASGLLCRARTSRSAQLPRGLSDQCATRVFPRFASSQSTAIFHWVSRTPIGLVASPPPIFCRIRPSPRLGRISHAPPRRRPRTGSHRGRCRAARLARADRRARIAAGGYV